MIFAERPARLARHLSTVRLAMANPAMRSRGLCGDCLVRSRSMMGVFMFFNFLGFMFNDGVFLNYCLFLPDPLFLPPPVSLFTVAQARASAVSRSNLFSRSQLRCEPPDVSVCQYNWIYRLEAWLLIPWLLRFLVLNLSPQSRL